MAYCNRLTLLSLTSHASPLFLFYSCQHIPLKPCGELIERLHMSRYIFSRRSRIHGQGVFARTLLHKGQRIIQYKGRLRSHSQVDALYATAPHSGHTFLFTLNAQYVIDANEQGNIARWINHSCAPNCEAVLEESADGNRSKDKVFIEAVTTIQPGEELTYNYGICLSERHTPRLKAMWACHGGARTCTGTLLQPQRQAKRKI